MSLLTGVVLMAAGMAMFWLSGRVGLGVTTLDARIAASFVLTRDPLKRWPSTILVPIVASVLIWFLFVWLIRVPLPPGLLF